MTPPEPIAAAGGDPFDRSAAFPRLADDQLAELAAVGRTRPVSEGERLFRAGDRAYDFFVVLSGRVAIVDDAGGPGERVIGVHGEGRFLGELSLVTGEPAYVDACVREAGEVLVVEREALRRVIRRNRRLGDLILGAYIARRELIVGLGSGVRLVGSHLSPETRRLRELLTRNRVPHTFLDLEDDGRAAAVLSALGLGPGETPLLVRGGEVLRRPSGRRVASALGLTTAVAAHEVCDTVIVGAGPAGLGAAVYAASEGLSAVLVDAVATGGQASTSSRIENYLGFPAGVSGADLAERAAIQASRFGVRTVVPDPATALEVRGGYPLVRLESGAGIHARSVVVATGASYRRLPVARLAAFEGAGVYYAATQVEAHACRDEAVVVVGAGNSAGQAAVYLSEHARAVHLVVRGSALEHTMSSYLVDQLRERPNVDLRCRTQVRELHGDGRLDGVTIAGDGDARRRLDAGALFVFIGADPCTAWLGGQLAVDEHGFVLAGQDLPPALLDGPGVAGGRAPLPLETSRAGVFVAGDVRAGSTKRVASAVGEGAMAIQLVHRYLAGLGGGRPAPGDDRTSVRSGGPSLARTVRA